MANRFAVSATSKAKRKRTHCEWYTSHKRWTIIDEQISLPAVRDAHGQPSFVRFTRSINLISGGDGGHLRRPCPVHVSLVRRVRGVVATRFQHERQCAILYVVHARHLYALNFFFATRGTIDDAISISHVCMESDTMHRFTLRKHFCSSTLHFFICTYRLFRLCFSNNRAGKMAYCVLARLPAEQNAQRVRHTHTHKHKRHSTPTLRVLTLAKMKIITAQQAF